MASLEQREDSQFWQVRFREPVTRKRTKQSTRYRWNNREETRSARELCARKTYEEKQSVPRSTHNDNWQAWVRPWLDSHYSHSPKTASRYLTAWRSIESLLDVKGITAPARLDHIAVIEFIDARRSSRRGRQTANKKPIAPGTIATDLKVLRLVMDEAIRRKFAQVNPCLRLGLSRKPLREIHEITTDEEKIIRKALEKETDWMRVSFEIAMAQGCRFNETRLALTDVDTTKGTVLFRAKGNKVFRTALNPLLIPLIEHLRRQGHTMTWDLPQTKLLQCGRNWTRFFRRKAKLPHIWFHCTRGTAITRAHRAGVSFPKAMRFFNHASSLVHFVYTRLGIEDVSEVADALAAFSVSSGVPRYNPSTEISDVSPATPARDLKSSDAGNEKRTRATSSRLRKSQAPSSPSRAVGS